MLWASLFAFLTALGSMATATLLNDLDQHSLSHAVSVLWLIIAMGLVAWMKVKVSHPQFGSVRRFALLSFKTVLTFHSLPGLLDGCPDPVCDMKNSRLAYATDVVSYVP